MQQQARGRPEVTIRHCSACENRARVAKRSTQTRCAYCGAMFAALTITAPRPLTKLCPLCGIEFSNNLRGTNKYCSKLCKTKYYESNARKTIRTTRKTPARKLGVCAYCNKLYTYDGRLVTRKYCGKVCCHKAQKAKQRTTTDPTNCAVCSKVLPARTSSAVRIYCSKVCNERSPATRARNKRKSGKRRAIKFNAFVSDVDRFAIYERDGWRCQICKLKVNPRYTGTHPKGPSLDHIIPLAVGGTHQPSNVQLAHFGCNARKSSRAANDQLLLIG